ncbi:ankyrin repeat domain-containing DHHC palmitoyltransferase family protein [Sporobolomyces koalae]|uniref:ankyrin repeat domain-containing DHHC palmitoyltransferase family protein n=1 Tax=Sporobolomyces koalae TaxID=500713 RepID=UPI00316E6B32
MAAPLTIPHKTAATTSASPAAPPSSVGSSSSPPPLAPSSPRSPRSPISEHAPLPPVELLPLHHAAQVNDLAFLDRFPPAASASSSSSPRPHDRPSVPPELDVNLTDAQGITALHWAAINGHLYFVKRLLDLGAQVDQRGGELSGTALMWAARNGHLAIVHLLLKHSSDPTWTDSQSFNCLHLATHSSSAYLLAYLLFTIQPISVDTPDQQGHTSLAWACYQGDAISVELLLKAGASPSRPDHAGLTPLHWAVTKGNSACIKRIIQAGARLDDRDQLGKTPRDMAIELKNFGSYKRALQECRLDEFGKPEDLPFKDPRHTQWVIFAVPFVGMAVMAKTFQLAPNPWIGWIVFALEAYGLHYTVTKVLLGIKNPNQSDRITKSNYLCAIIVASLVWVAWVWITRYLHVPNYGTTNFLFATSISTCAYNFYRAITLNPGRVSPSANDVELKDVIEGLVEQGNFNGMNFCLTCLVKRPLRSKHSYATGQCVGRFDHYCPWVWNDNFALSPSLPIDASCSFVPTPLCQAIEFDTFALAITVWAALQLTWTVILLGVQIWQISKQVTTLEVSNLGRYGYMGGKPGISAPHQQGAVAKFEAARQSAAVANLDHTLNSQGTAGDADSTLNDPTSLSHAPTRTSSRPSGAFGFLLKLLGLDRFGATARAAHSHSHSQRGSQQQQQQENPFDLGCKTNCLDFWQRGGQLGIKWNDPNFEIPVGGFAKRLPLREGRKDTSRAEYERVAMEEV